MKDWKEVRCCPVCGGRLLISEFCTLSRDYRIKRDGKISKKYTVTRADSIDCINASCDDCGEVWDASEVCLENDGTLFLKVKGEE